MGGAGGIEVKEDITIQELGLLTQVVLTSQSMGVVGLSFMFPAIWEGHPGDK